MHNNLGECIINLGVFMFLFRTHCIVLQLVKETRDHKPYDIMKLCSNVHFYVLINTSIFENIAISALNAKYEHL